MLFSQRLTVSRREYREFTYIEIGVTIIEKKLMTFQIFCVILEFTLCLKTVRSLSHFLHYIIWIVLCLDDFPFFWFLSSLSRTRAKAVWSLGVWELIPLAMMMICRTFISQTSNSSRSLNGHFSRPAETDPYALSKDVDYQSLDKETTRMTGSYFNKNISKHCSILQINRG